MAFKAAFLACVVSLFSALAGFGQTLSETAAADLAPYDAALGKFLGEPGAVVHTWIPGAPGCDGEWADGHLIRSIHTENVFVAAKAFWSSGRKLDVGVLVMNNSSHTVDVLPERAAIQAFGRKGKILRAEDPERVAARMQTWAAITAAVVRTAPLFQRTYSEAWGSVGGQPVRIHVESPDELARAQGAADADRLMADAAWAAAQVEAAALKANTLRPGESVVGYLTFPLQKKMKFYRVALVVDRDIFCFLYGGSK